jgi:preprotein translocase subunit SecE
MARQSVGEFVRQVRQETSKVTWPSRTETVQSTVMVLIMVFLAAMFFFVVDLGLAALIQQALRLGG